MINIGFRVIARAKTEDSEGTVYQVRLKSPEGHRLILKSKQEAALHGYTIGERVSVQLKNPQKTLEATP